MERTPEIGNFTGPNGTPLPAGVKIYDPETGGILQFTEPVGPAVGLRFFCVLVGM